MGIRHGAGEVESSTVGTGPENQTAVEPASRAGREEPLPASAPVRRNILLAEDNEPNRRLAEKFLRMRGHTVTAVANGRQALDALAGGCFDLVLMDVSMPEMDGLEATMAVRTHDGSAFDPAIPIIAVTAHAVKGDRERFLEAGMNAYLSKPLDLEQFERAVRETVSSTRGTPAAKPAVQASSGVAAVQTAPPSMSQEPPFDADLQDQRFAGMKDFLPELLAVYLKNVGPTLEKVREALDQDDLPGASKAVHTLKGMSSVVCATPVQTLAGNMESMAKLGEPQAVQALLPELEAQVARAIVYLNATLPEQP